MSDLNMQFVNYKGFDMPFETFRKHRDAWTLEILFNWLNKVMDNSEVKEDTKEPSVKEIEDMEPIVPTKEIKVSKADLSKLKSK